MGKRKESVIEHLCAQAPSYYSSPSHHRDILDVPPNLFYTGRIKDSDGPYIMSVSHEAMHETMKDIVKLSELIKNVAIFYQFAKPYEKEQIIRTIFSELYIDKTMLQYKVKKGFEPFENRFDAICDPTGNRTPIFAVKGRCPSR